MRKDRSHNRGDLCAALWVLLALVTFNRAMAAGAPPAAIPEAPPLAQLLDRAHDLQLADSPVWLALLHVGNGQTSNIQDPSFLLSAPNFTTQAELDRSIEALFERNQAARCRFPARYYWLHLRLLGNPPDANAAGDNPACEDVEEFRRKAPLDHLALIFASENIAQPASMLGHALLKFSGQNPQGQQISHAISFFTDTKTINLPKLLFDSLALGKQGHFSLSPFSEKQQLYVDVEQRNLWEYPLILEDWQKELIRLHLIELKQTSLVYFFQRYNCATVLSFIISLSGERLDSESWWITPKSLIKSAHAAHLTGPASMIAPSRWLVRNLQDRASPEEIQRLRQHVTADEVINWVGAAEDDSTFMRLKLAQAYNEYAYVNNLRSRALWQDTTTSLLGTEKARFSAHALKVDDRCNPLKAPGENALTLAAERSEGVSRAVLTVLPVAHTLLDDNRAFDSESSLQLFAASFAFTEGTSHPRLQRLVLYDMASLMPADPLTGGYSGQIRVALEPLPDRTMRETQTAHISGSIGSTQRWVPDLDAYTLIGLELQRNGANSSANAFIRTGMVLREIWNMKSIVELTHHRYAGPDQRSYNALNVSQAWYIDAQHALHLDYHRNFRGALHTDFVAASLTRTF